MALHIRNGRGEVWCGVHTEEILRVKRETHYMDLTFAHCQIDEVYNFTILHIN